MLVRRNKYYTEHVIRLPTSIYELKCYNAKYGVMATKTFTRLQTSSEVLGTEVRLSTLHHMRREVHYTIGTKAFTNTVGLGGPNTSVLLWSIWTRSPSTLKYVVGPHGVQLFQRAWGDSITSMGSKYLEVVGLGGGIFQGGPFFHDRTAPRERLKSSGWPCTI